MWKQISLLVFSSTHMSLSDTPLQIPKIVDSSWKIAILRSVWHPECTRALSDDAHRTLIDAGIKEESITMIDAPGSFELPLLAKEAIEQKDVDGVILFGVIVQGKTHHARLIAEQCAAGAMQLQMTTGVPVTFEILFVDALEDATRRSIGADGKGPLAAATLLTCLAKKCEMRS